MTQNKPNLAWRSNWNDTLTAQFLQCRPRLRPWPPICVIWMLTVTCLRQLN